MVRRKPYTKVEKQNQLRPEHVKGMGDVVFKGFQCLDGDCREFIFVRLDEIEADFCIQCPSCGFKHEAGAVTKFYDYSLKYTKTGEIIEEGEFQILHDDYVREALEFKYCIICYTMKPLHYFDTHSARASGRQGECRLCKLVYNSIKNQSRITDQHREASQRRRLYKSLSAETSRIDSEAVHKKFGGKCFNCGKELKYKAKGKVEYGMDHTLPARFLWPITTDNATLLCSSCNNNKHDQWPSEFYNQTKLKALARLTGVLYDVLAGPAVLNEDAVREILKDVDGFIEQWIKYPDDIKKVHRLILDKQGVDIFDSASVVPPYLKE